MSEQKMMTLADYLASEAAREDVRRLLSEPRPRVVHGDPVGWRHYGVQAEPYPAPPSVWCGISVDWGGSLPLAEWKYLTVYYRPDGERYIVTDLGEGVKAKRLRTGQHLAGWENWFNGEVESTAGVITLRFVDAGDLADAICRVMLASLRVAQS